MVYMTTFRCMLETRVKKGKLLSLANECDALPSYVQKNRNNQKIGVLCEKKGYCETTVVVTRQAER